MQLVVQTRFSFFGRSGWKSAASLDPDELFASERLEERFRIFEMMCLPSLLGQDDQDFKWQVLSSSLMPEKYQRRLTELLHDNFGSRAKVGFEPPAKAGNYFQKYMRRDFVPSDMALQTVLDDDDGLSSHFVSSAKVQGRKIYDNGISEEGYRFLSFPRGLSAEHLADGSLRISAHSERFINLGLTLVARADFFRNCYQVRHTVINRAHPFTCRWRDGPYFIRSIHGVNDSNPTVSNQKLVYSGDFLGANFAYILPQTTRLAAA